MSNDKMTQLSNMIKFWQLHRMYQDWSHPFATCRLIQDVIFCIEMERYNREKLNPIELKLGRMSDPKAELTDGEEIQIRAVIGGIGWVDKQARPDETLTASFLRSSFHEAVTKDLADANASVRRLKSDPLLGLRIMPCEVDEARVASVSDGSFDTDKATGASQGGFIVGITTTALNNNEEAPFSTMSWVSHKIKRVVGSTMAAESFSFSDALAEAEWIWALWQETVWSDYDPKTRRRSTQPEREDPAVAVLKSDSTISIDPSVVSVVDADFPFDNLVKETTGGNERRVAFELCACRQSMRAIGCKARCFQHHCMPADAFTRRAPNAVVLTRVMRSGSVQNL